MRTIQSQGGKARAKSLTANERHEAATHAARARWQKGKSFKSINALVFHTTSKTFKRYWMEMERHRKAVLRIYGRDTKHVCKARETGSVNKVWPDKYLLVTFYECALCGRDMTKEMAKENEP